MTASDTRLPLRRAVLIGVTGRMGCALLRAAPGFPRLIVIGAIASPASLALGRDAGQVAGMGTVNLTVTSDLPRALAQADVALDFSSASAAAENLAACRAAGKPLLLGTTGFGDALERELAAAARDIPLLVAANTSLGAALLTGLVRAAARALPASFDIDVLDLHHRLKQDAPSGTALALAAAAAEERGLAPPAGGNPTRPGPRGEGEIGFAALRAGDLVGEHTVFFTGAGEELILTHRARDRAVFARGALAAALWLASQPPGRYGMREFLGLKTGT
ncbi:MAG TPA: 4-hydroxy-tetrahydrodipicolinate reductase [Steroidobacteraceae bacterium]|nr:4-hydroxy-tetrahydrodipicolinate reductase [Steroidobacteraceae bacterium]